MEPFPRQIRLDFRSQEPIYQQIVRQVKHMVQDGSLKPGDQLPTVRQMAIDLRINFSTVARAYHILDELKLISTQRGRGTYIWEDENMADPGANERAPYPRAPEAHKQVENLVCAMLDQAVEIGISLEEIERAFQREIRRRQK